MPLKVRVLIQMLEEAGCATDAANRKSPAVPPPRAPRGDYSSRTFRGRFGDRNGSLYSEESGAEKEMKYAVIIENAGPNWSAYSPDVPGCITTGPTYEETVTNMREALHLHLKALTELGQPLPVPNTRAIEIEAA